ncbi:hypothetical protein [Aureimonas sp. AU20]|uniref:hypothetical protein n=1 Tax=Aureimonas sp. AU20 TaxID=1349819 RepID=UPI00071EA108|nr:hypothetical protein [Aureimonas sp. AU20]ALN73544.1 hypothetical protein M673_12530 [Aureimonas sp. AU20]
MRTASEKKKRGRGGHNKKLGVPRYPSGDVNHAAIEKQKDIVSVATAARVRLFGIAANDALSDKAGSVFGRMYLQGELGPVRGKEGMAEAVYEAGMEFARRRKAYLSAISAPPSPRSSSELSGGGRHIGVDNESDAYAQHCARSRARYAEIRRVCLDADAMSIMALETIVCEDKMSAALVGSLRIGCNAIHRTIMSQKRG